MATADIVSALATAKTTKICSLAFMGLTAVPVQVWELTDLVRLDLSNNDIESLPSEIGRLTKLRELWLNGNPVSSLPSDIEFCQSLQFLDLRRTNVSSLPKEVSRLPKLADVSLSQGALNSRLSAAYGAGTRSLLQHLAHKDEKRQLKDLLRRRLDTEVYREVSNTSEGSDMIAALVKQVLKEFSDFSDLRLLIRNSERLFPSDLVVADAKAIRKTFVSLQRDNAKKKLAADVELKLRALYFNRIKVERVEAMVHDIYRSVTTLEDIKFLLHFAVQLFPDSPDDVSGSGILEGIKALRRRRAEERAAAVAMLTKALCVMYGDTEPSDVSDVSLSVSKLFKSVTDIKQLAADAATFFPTEFTSVRPRRVLREYHAAKEEKKAAE